MKMCYCKRCLQPDTRPGIIFDDKGVCYACRYEEEKNKTDWAQREKDLRDIADHAKKEAEKAGQSYDCVIGVSGGKDSLFQSLYARDKLGLHPLLVNCMPDHITEIGRKNIENLNHLGFDIVSLRPNPKVAQKLARKSFFTRGNIIAASEYCLWASSYLVAMKMDIPLIIQGENAALTLGAATHQKGGDDAYSVVDLETLRGADVESFIDAEDGITERDLYLYRFPEINQMRERGIRAIFLQYYVKEWSQVRNADFAIARGLVGRTGDLHDLGRYRRFTALDSDMQIVNQMIKYLKFGFGYATDEAGYDIREGRLTRADAVWYVEEYDGKCGEQYIDLACDYLEISKERFWEVVDTYVNKDLFEKKDGRWVKRFTVGIDYDSER